MTKTEQAGRIMQLWGWICTFLMLNVLFVILYTGFDYEDSDQKLILAIVGFQSVFSILTIAVGRALKYQKIWSRFSSIIIIIVSLLLFPVGTFFGVIIIMYLYQGRNDEPIKI